MKDASETVYKKASVSLDRIKKAPTFMGEPSYTNELDSKATFLQDIYNVRKALYELEMYEDVTIPRLKRVIYKLATGTKLNATDKGVINKVMLTTSELDVEEDEE